MLGKQCCLANFVENSGMYVMLVVPITHPAWPSLSGDFCCRMLTASGSVGVEQFRRYFPQRCTVEC